MDSYKNMRNIYDNVKFKSFKMCAYKNENIANDPMTAKRLKKYQYILKVRAFFRIF